MNTTAIARLRAFISADPSDIDSSGLADLGIELSLGLVGIVAIGLVTGAMSLTTGGALLAVCTGFAVLTNTSPSTLVEPANRSF